MAASASSKKVDFKKPVITKDYTLEDGREYLKEALENFKDDSIHIDELDDSIDRVFTWLSENPAPKKSRKSKNKNA